MHFGSVRDFAANQKHVRFTFCQRKLHCFTADIYVTYYAALFSKTRKFGVVDVTHMPKSSDTTVIFSEM